MTGRGAKAKTLFPSLSEEQFRRMHEASLEILDRVGVRLYLAEAVELLRKAGARVDDGNLVHVPARLVEKSLPSVPTEVTLYSRDGNPAMRLGGYRSYYGPGSDCLNIIDHRSGVRRKPTVQDVVDGAVLCDYLPHIDFAMSMMLPADVDGTIADRYQMEAMLSATKKPIIYVTYEMSGSRDAVEMAEAVMGGEEALRRTPTIAAT
jgi:trimethylamine--corrinoid protein Co-methyltransferase